LTVLFGAVTYGYLNLDGLSSTDYLCSKTTKAGNTVTVYAGQVAVVDGLGYRCTGPDGWSDPIYYYEYGQHYCVNEVSTNRLFFGVRSGIQAAAGVVHNSYIDRLGVEHNWDTPAPSGSVIWTSTDDQKSFSWVADKGSSSKDIPSSLTEYSSGDFRCDSDTNTLKKCASSGSTLGWVDTRAKLRLGDDHDPLHGLELLSTPRPCD